MTELDNFIEVLKTKYDKTDYTFRQNTLVKSKYEQFAHKFRTKRGLAATLKKCGSPELVIALYKKERSAFFKEHRTTIGEDRKLRRLTYVRYVDDFIVGITGPRDFALKIATEIKSFIKSDLHLCIHDVILTSRDKGAAKFLGFNIYLSSIKNKAKSKSTKIKSIEKYRRRSIARLKGNDARISQAYFNSIKHGFLNYLQNVYEKLNLKKNKNTDMLLIQNFVNKNIRKLFRINSQQGIETLNPNLALRRYTQHFRYLFSKNMHISLEIWKENFESLEPFDENFVLTKDLSKVIKARDKFLAELELVKDSVIDKTREFARQEAIEFYKEKQTLKFFHKTTISKLSAREFARTAELLSLRTIDITRQRRISIRFDIKKFYSKLIDLGFYSVKSKSPISLVKLIFLNDYEIISFYNTLIKDYLN